MANFGWTNIGGDLVTQIKNDLLPRTQGHSKIVIEVISDQQAFIDRRID